MEQRHTLWHNRRAVMAALYVDYTGETAKAIQFTVVDNPRLSFWLPKKAVKFAEDNQATIAHWFPVTGFALDMFEHYGSHYSR